MTQPPENPGGQPAGGQSPDEQDASAPASVPPPGSWHFPPGVASPSQTPPGTSQSHGAPPPYGPGQGQPNGSPHPHGAPPPGAPSPPGAPLQYGAPPPGPPLPYGAPPPYGTSPYYGTPPYGAPQPYGTAYPSYAAGPSAGPEPDLAEWWRRLLGRLIDIMVLSVLTAPIAIAVLSPAFSRYQQTLNRYPDLSQPGAQTAISQADGRLFGTWLVFAAIVAVISFFYDSIQHGLWGRTLGKRALGTRVVSGYDRSKIGGGAAAGRAAVYSLIPVIPLVGSLFWLLDALWLTWDRRRQCLHDKAARTIVVKNGFPPAAPQPGSPW